MKVLSCFDGVSCGRLALERAGITVDAYLASEINEHAMSVVRRNRPDTAMLGSIERVLGLAWTNRLGPIDLLIGGSPCQGFSQAGYGAAFNDPRSRLLMEFVAIKNLTKPKWFLLENVKMENWCLQRVNKLMGVTGRLLCSSSVSAQVRKRYFWTNIPINITNKKVTLADILQTDVQDVASYKLNRTTSRIKMWADGKGTGNLGTCINLADRQRSNTVTTSQDRWNNAGLIPYEDFCRYLTHVECERLQTIPDNWTAGLGKRARYEAIGNAWTVDLVAEIFKGLKP